MSGHAEKLLAARQRMVSDQLRGRDITHERVLEAFFAVPREWFIPPEQRHEAYEDRPVPIGRGQTISQPYVVAVMLQELDVKETDCVLDVGAGSGYQTALLARLAKHVYAIERIDALAQRAMTALADVGARNVTMKVADGSLGWPEKAPFDGIICGAGAPDVPEAWGNQLADGRRMVLPVGQAHAQSLVVVEKTGGKLHRRRVCDVRFVKLIGKHGWPG